MPEQNKGPIDPEILDGGESLTAITKGEIDIQIATAQRYKRDITKVRDEVLSIATLNQETAESCYYLIPRDGKQIIGESIRLAEILANAWGNSRYGVRVVGIEQKFVKCQGVFFDLEKNNMVSVEGLRRITKKNGTRYSDDMIQTTAGACASIVLRNAILRGIPKSILKSVEGVIKKKALGDDRTLPVRRKAAVEFFKKENIPLSALLRTAGAETLEGIDLIGLQKLVGIRNAIRDGDITAAEAFGMAPKAGKDPLAAGKHEMSKKAKAEAEEKAQKAAQAPQAADQPEKAPEPPPAEKAAQESPQEETADQLAEVRAELTETLMAIPPAEQDKILGHAGILMPPNECVEVKLMQEAIAATKAFIEKRKPEGKKAAAPAQKAEAPKEEAVVTPGEDIQSLRNKAFGAMSGLDKKLAAYIRGEIGIEGSLLDCEDAGKLKELIRLSEKAKADGAGKQGEMY